MVNSGPRMSADERRESVIRAAVVEFARTGYHGTSTEAIARRVGVSQPYLFRLFPGKQALFRAAAERCFDRTAETFEVAADGLSGAEALEAMGEAYSLLIRDRDVLMLQMQLYVAAASAEDPELADFIRRRWTELWDIVRSRTGASDEELTGFFGHGMLINTLLALGIPAEDRCWDGFDGACKLAAAEVYAQRR
ncbi:TetR/AcrR family transcriptional regulator [Streptantibioticus rubrisoli]|uniref:TetR/AcrR family transcriptional regulator n=1 Tax=Streptantibioticus rubrisoli TaxID=1387313 RepID=A0ABT1PFV9_9ACTN|nr:TetR/AcrR family transcriptional regulator [Streptantibioticus rubrisoli]MCQ4044257.1 TetR/AcrR family transcriptional regulator [Streptantibioticus rubrisoli]